MIKPFPFRALSPHHATAMDLDYLLKVVDAAREYGFNALQICGDTHGHGNLDGIEAAVPACCLDAEGRCRLELAVPEPDRSPYLAEVRLEAEARR
ncbi:MAG: hypothetical protein ACYS5V_11920 [Planctomycetota bacterium]|jgi:isopropylmalate/homocitrate/citramalate synthase